MVDKEIFGGLKNAIERGSSLKEAMMSFYNAGYAKKDIEEAAREFQMEQFQMKNPQYQQPQNFQPIPQSFQQLQVPQAQMPKPPINATPLSVYNSPTENQPVQKVSNYAYTPKKRFSWATFLLVIMLLILLGALVSVFIFQNQLIEFFQNQFS